MTLHRNPVARLVAVVLATVLLNLAASTGAQAQIQVTAADPPSGAQGTINLTVKITGKGFKNGAKAKWYLTGTTNPGGVTVNSTTFVSSGELSADITIADTATIANFDILVANADGRSGKGTELFAVTAKGNPSSCVDGGYTPAPYSYAAIPAPSCLSQSGSLDVMFGVNGIAATQIIPPNYAVGVVVQPDGKAVLSVSAANPVDTTKRDVYVIRYDSYGNLDASFGIAGVARVPFTPCLDSEIVAAIALQSDGKILVAGSAPTERGTLGFALERLNANGTPDTTFGTDGTALLGFSSDASARAMAIQSDGKIALAGTTNSSMDFAVARFNANGSPDGTFGSAGKVVVATAKNASTQFGGAYAVVIEAINGEERIVAAGARPITNRAASDFALMRFTPSGTLDSSFGGGGMVFTDFYGYNDGVKGLAIVGGYIVAGGFAYRNTTNAARDFALARYNSDGTLDISFGGNGKVTTDIAGGLNDLYGIAVRADGSIVAVGVLDWQDGAGNRDITLARYKPNGSLDTTFGCAGNGIVITNAFVDDNPVGGLALQLDGNIVVAGIGVAGTGASSQYVLLARYLY